jgi:hypothetical protein
MLIRQAILFKWLTHLAHVLEQAIKENKGVLSFAVAVHKGYTNDPNSGNYAASNQTLANLNMILNHAASPL